MKKKPKTTYCAKCLRTSNVVDMSNCPFCNPQPKEKKEAWAELTIEGAEQWLAKLGLLTSRGAKLLMVKKLIAQERKKVIEELKCSIMENWRKLKDENYYETLDEIIKRLK